MNLVEMLKGVWNKMIGAKTIESVLKITPTISNEMKEAIELWEQMYMNESPWLTENVKSLNLASLISSEKARTATIEMEVKITGESDMAKFMKDAFQKVELKIREQLEYGIALGGLVIKPYVTLGADGKYVMEFDYSKATDFYPFSFSQSGKVTEAAFIDRIITKDKVYAKLEYHKLEGNKVIVKNAAFEMSSDAYSTSNSFVSNELGKPIPLTEVSEWAELEPVIEIPNMTNLLFAYFKMPEANTVDLQSPLGASGFSRAVSLIKEADEIYSDLLWEFEGSQLAVDIDRTAVNPMKNPDGTYKEILPKLQDRLFRRTLDLGSDETYNVFSPTIRDASIINGLNNQLMRIEDACALSRGTLSVVTESEARTATELKILKQRSFSANQDIQKALQTSFEQLFVIMEQYCILYNIVAPGEYEVAYKWDDSILVDKESERQQDLIEVQNGLMSKREYRMKWYGETEKQAEESLKIIDDEKTSELERTQSVMMQYTNNGDDEKDSSAKSEAQAKNDKMKRANESNETTTKDPKQEN